MSTTSTRIAKRIKGRHHWGEPSRPDENHTYRECVWCGCVKISRHEGDRHWVEYGDGDKTSPRAPRCQGDG